MIALTMEKLIFFSLHAGYAGMIETLVALAIAREVAARKADGRAARVEGVLAPFTLEAVAESTGVEAGKLADLIVVEGNPLADLRRSEYVAYVMLGGRLYDARTMNEVGNHPNERGPFFWER